MGVVGRAPRARRDSRVCCNLASRRHQASGSFGARLARKASADPNGPMVCCRYAAWRQQVREWRRARRHSRNGFRHVAWPQEFIGWSGTPLDRGRVMYTCTRCIVVATRRGDHTSACGNAMAGLSRRHSMMECRHAAGLQPTIGMLGTQLARGRVRSRMSRSMVLAKRRGNHDYTSGETQMVPGKKQGGDGGRARNSTHMCIVHSIPRL